MLFASILQMEIEQLREEIKALERPETVTSGSQTEPLKNWEREVRPLPLAWREDQTSLWAGHTGLAPGKPGRSVRCCAATPD